MKINKSFSNGLMLTKLILLLKIGIMLSMKTTYNKFLDDNYDKYGNKDKLTQGYFTAKNGYFTHTLGESELNKVHIILAILIIGILLFVFSIQFTFWVAKKSIKYKTLMKILQNKKIIDESDEERISPLSIKDLDESFNTDNTNETLCIMKSKFSYIRCKDEKSQLPSFIIDDILADNKGENYIELLEDKIIGVEIKFEKLSGIIVDRWEVDENLSRKYYNTMTFADFHKITSKNEQTIKVETNKEKKISTIKDKPIKNNIMGKNDETPLCDISYTYFRKFCSSVNYKFHLDKEKKFYCLFKEIIEGGFNYKIINPESDVIDFYDGDIYLKYIFNKPIESDIDEIFREKKNNLDKFKKDFDYRISIEIIYLNKEYYNTHKFYMGKLHESTVANVKSRKVCKQNCNSENVNIIKTSNHLQSPTNSIAYSFEPFNTGVKETSFSLFVCCFEFDKEIILCDAYETDTTKKQIYDSILHSQSTSSTKLIIQNIFALILLYVGILASLLSVKILFGHIPQIGHVGMEFVVAASLSLTLTIFFFIYCLIWLIYVDLKYLMLNFLMCLISIALVVGSVFLFTVTPKNQNGFNGIPLKFDNNNTLIMSA